MKLTNMFKKKKPYPDELQDCLDRIELLKVSLVKMYSRADADHETFNHIAQLGEEFQRWDAMAKGYIRYREVTFTTTYGTVKL